MLMEDVSGLSLSCFFVHTHFDLQKLTHIAPHSSNVTRSKGISLCVNNVSTLHLLVLHNHTIVSSLLIPYVPNHLLSLGLTSRII